MTKEPETKISSISLDLKYIIPNFLNKIIVKITILRDLYFFYLYRTSGKMLYRYFKKELELI